MGLTKEANKRIAERNVDRRVARLNEIRANALNLLNLRTTHQSNEHMKMTESFGLVMQAVAFINDVKGFYMDVTIGAFASSFVVYFLDKDIRRNILTVTTNIGLDNGNYKFSGYKLKEYVSGENLSIGTMHPKEAESAMGSTLETAAAFFIEDNIELFRNL